MRKMIVAAALICVAACAAPLGAQAAGQAKKSQVTEANKVQVNERAESDYGAYLEREKAEDAKELQGMRTKIEDKYKGYVRPKHDKKNAKEKQEKKK